MSDAQAELSSAELYQRANALEAEVVQLRERARAARITEKAPGSPALQGGEEWSALTLAPYRVAC